MGEVLAGRSRGKLQRDNALPISSASPPLMGPLALYFDGPYEQRPGVRQSTSPVSAGPHPSHGLVAWATSVSDASTLTSFFFLGL